MLDCEAAYYFPKSLDICGALDGSTEPDLIEDKVAAKNAITSESHEEKGGSLVIHVRSGDVFRRKKAYRSYGQVRCSSNSNLNYLVLVVLGVFASSNVAPFVCVLDDNDQNKKHQRKGRPRERKREWLTTPMIRNDQLKGGCRQK